MRLCRHEILWLVVLFLGFGVVSAQEFQVESSVDRTEIAAGESVVLTLTVTQSLQGVGPTLNVPRIPPMDGLDVVSQRSAQNMSIINGVGHIQVQTVAEILPKAPGSYTIPGFSLKGPDGKIYSTKPINIKVTESRPPIGDEEPAPSPSGDVSEEKPAGVSLIKGLLIIFGVVALVVISPLAFSWFTSSGTGRSRNVQAEVVNGRRINPDQTGSHQSNSNGRKPQTFSKPSIVEQQATPIFPQQTAHMGTVRKGSESDPIDFDCELVQLKRRYLDGGPELHREFFDLFHRFLVEISFEDGASLTPGELMDRLARRASPNDVELIRRLADEWERLVYARMSPARPFAGVEQDARAVLKWARTQEK